MGDLVINFDIRHRASGSQATPGSTSPPSPGEAPEVDEEIYLMKNFSTPGEYAQEDWGELKIKYEDDWTTGSGASPGSSSSTAPGRALAHSEEIPLRKDSSTPTKNAHETVGELNINFGEVPTSAP